MNPLLTIILRYVCRAAKYAGIATAAVNAGRLNTPETAAGPVDYLIYCGIPGILGPIAAWGEWLTGDRDGGVDDPGLRSSAAQEQLRQMVVQFMRAGRFDASRRLSDLAELLERDANAHGPEK